MFPQTWTFWQRLFRYNSEIIEALAICCSQNARTYTSQLTVSFLRSDFVLLTKEFHLNQLRCPLHFLTNQLKVHRRMARINWSCSLEKNRPQRRNRLMNSTTMKTYFRINVAFIEFRLCWHNHPINLKHSLYLKYYWKQRCIKLNNLFIVNPGVFLL